MSALKATDESLITQYFSTRARREMSKTQNAEQKLQTFKKRAARHIAFAATFALIVLVFAAIAITTGGMGAVIFTVASVIGLMVVMVYTRDGVSNYLEFFELLADKPSRAPEHKNE